MYIGYLFVVKIKQTNNLERTKKNHEKSIVCVIGFKLFGLKLKSGLWVQVFESCTKNYCKKVKYRNYSQTLHNSTWYNKKLHKNF